MSGPGDVPLLQTVVSLQRQPVDGTEPHVRRAVLSLISDAFPGVRDSFLRRLVSGPTVQCLMLCSPGRGVSGTAARAIPAHTKQACAGTCHAALCTRVVQSALDVPQADQAHARGEYSSDESSSDDNTDDEDDDDSDGGGDGSSDGVARTAAAGSDSDEPMGPDASDFASTIVGVACFVPVELRRRGCVRSAASAFDAEDSVLQLLLFAVARQWRRRMAATRLVARVVALGRRYSAVGVAGYADPRASRVLHAAGFMRYTDELKGTMPGVLGGLSALPNPFDDGGPRASKLWFTTCLTPPPRHVEPGATAPAQLDSAPGSAACASSGGGAAGDGSGSSARRGSSGGTGGGAGASSGASSGLGHGSDAVASDSPHDTSQLPHLAGGSSGWVWLAPGSRAFLDIESRFRARCDTAAGRSRLTRQAWHRCRTMRVLAVLQCSAVVEAVPSSPASLFCAVNRGYMGAVTPVVPGLASLHGRECPLRRCVRPIASDWLL